MLDRVRDRQHTSDAPLAPQLVRTYCDVWMIDINTMIESSIISRNRKKFMVNLSHFAMFLLPIACVVRHVHTCVVAHPCSPHLPEWWPRTTC